MFHCTNNDDIRIVKYSFTDSFVVVCIIIKYYSKNPWASFLWELTDCFSCSEIYFIKISDYFKSNTIVKRWFKRRTAKFFEKSLEVPKNQNCKNKEYYSISNK